MLQGAEYLLLHFMSKILAKINYETMNMSFPTLKFASFHSFYFSLDPESGMCRSFLDMKLWKETVFFFYKHSQTLRRHLWRMQQYASRMVWTGTDARWLTKDSLEKTCLSWHGQHSAQKGPWLAVRSTVKLDETRHTGLCLLKHMNETNSNNTGRLVKSNDGISGICWFLLVKDYSETYFV